MTTDTKDISPENIAGIFVDHENARVLVFTKDILINQLQREVPEINNSFDSIFAEDLKNLSESLSYALPTITIGQNKAIKENDELLETCGLLLQNSGNTILASVLTLRSGFPLQSGILIRTVIETCAVIFHLLSRPDDLEKFKRNEFKSTNAISTAQKMLPLFGNIWASLSKQFIHINNMHSDFYSIKKYTDGKDVPAKTTIGILGLAIWYLQITTELTFIKSVENPKHWTVLENGKMQFIPPSETEMDWIKKSYPNKTSPNIALPIFGQDQHSSKHFIVTDHRLFWG